MQNFISQFITVRRIDKYLILINKIKEQIKYLSIHSSKAFSENLRVTEEANCLVK